MLSVGLIEKYPAICTGLDVTLSNKFEGITIHTQSNLDDFYQVFKARTFHVIILSFYENSLDQSLILIQRCKKLFPSFPIIAFAEKANAGEVLSVMKAGAGGYVFKQDSLNEMVNCINATIVGKRYFNPSVKDEIMDQIFFTKKRELRILNGLTEKQFAIAKYLANGVSTSKIAEILNLKASTISTVKAIVYRKLKVGNVLELSAIVTKHKR